jgi:hypothetical protein
MARQVGGHRLDHRQIVLAQPATGKAVGGLQGEVPIPVVPAPGRPDPGFEGGFAEIGVEGLLDPVPKLFALLHHSLSSRSVGI